MQEPNYDYATCVRNSEKVCWTLDEVFPPDTRLDFSRPFLPAALSGERDVDGLSEDDKRRLNQISGHAYLNLFAFVEEFIIATAMRHAQAEMHGDHAAMRALLRFADEEVKHQDLFDRYKRAFNSEFGTTCGVLDNAVEVAGIVLSKTPIAVMMMTLHIELMTLAHYTESVRPDASIDELFASLLKHHWLEEAQHARIDGLELTKLCNLCTPDLIERGFSDYLDLTEAISGLLLAQAKMDLDSLSRASGTTYPDELCEQIVTAQHRAYRNTFLVLGMENPQFVAAMKALSPSGAGQVAARARTYA